ncbi:MAG: arylsulfatase [Phycisphaerae bacterium]|nr:arylsulfatase [Phycisphaerae bacterium]
MAGCAGSFQSRSGSRRPNILVILSDDMGFSDLGCFGGVIDTPNLDSLAASGLRFTQFYNTARCCPTRASLLTGLYPHQAGIGHMMEDKGYDGYRGDLSRNAVTIAEVLKSAGYGTYMCGKWHVTPRVRPEALKYNWPCQRGFERFFGTIAGAGSYFDPSALTLDNMQIPPGEDFYYTDAISDHAVQFISENPSGRPFFLYVAYTAAHWPLHARPEDIAKYKGRFDAGWDTMRLEKLERMRKMGLIDPEWELTPRDPNVPAWEDEPLKEWHLRRMEVYAAMIDCMDRGIGRIVECLRKSGQLDDTLILFMQDNGGCAEEIGSAAPQSPEPAAPMAPDELQLQSQPKNTRRGDPVRRGKGVLPGGADTYQSYGQGWANASNTPFRLYKHWVHEGGISTPLIAHWPARVRDRGAIRDQSGHLIDIMPTCIEAAQAEYPTQFSGHAITPLVGRSLFPAFDNRPIERPEGLFWEHEGNRAVRMGRYKLVARHNQPWELYDMTKDRSELHDLSAEQPELTARMKDMYEKWAQRSQVMPWEQVNAPREKVKSQS